MRKISLIVLLLFFSTISLLNSEQVVQDMGMNSFLKFIKKNQTQLGINSFGVIDKQKEEKLIRIYCNENFDIAQFKKLLSKFEYDSHSIDRSLPETIIFEVRFKNKVTKSQITKDKNKPKSKNIKKKCKNRIKVQVTQIQPSEFDEYIKYNGMLIPGAKFEMAANVSGLISSVNVNIGDQVTKGQTIFKLDTSKISDNIKNTNAEIKKWEEIYFKRSHWKVRKAKAEKFAQKKIRQFKLTLKDLQNKLNESAIMSTFSGKILSIAKVGESIDKESIVAVIVNSSKMKLIVKNKEFNLLLKDGMVIKTQVEKLPGKLSGLASHQDGFAVLTFDNETGKLKSSMSANFITLRKTHTNVIVIDSVFIKKINDELFTYVVNGKKASIRTLKTGPSEKGKTIVLEGLKEGDELIVSGLDCVKDSKKIKVMVWDEKKGKFRKRKKNERPVTKSIDPKLKKTQIYTTKKRYKKKPFGISLGYNFTTMADSIIKDVYGSTIHGIGIEFSYLLGGKIETFLGLGYSSVKGTFTEYNETTTLSMVPLYLGVKYTFITKSKFTPFIGGSLAYYSVKEKPDIEYFEETPYLTNLGFSLLGGSYYNINSKLDIYLNVKYDVIKFDVSGMEDPVDFSGIRFTFGLKLNL